MSLAVEWVLVLAAVFAVFGAPCPAQVAWGQAQPTTSPAARDGTRMAWDSARQEVLLFGGDGHAPRSDTWSWNGTTWSLLAPTTTPTERAWHALVSDPVRQRVLLFGGSDNSGTNSETWEWNGTDWLQATPVAMPPARAFPAMAYDAVLGEVILFGGFPAQTPLGDTWSWDGVHWTNRAPATTPPARGWHAMAGDHVRGEVVMTGGYTGGASLPFADTWIWNGVDWAQRQPATQAPGQIGAAMVFDAARQRVVMSLGFERPQSAQMAWEWDGATWQSTTTGTGPIGNWDHGLAYDDRNERVVHFGGRLGGSGASDQTWEYSSLNPAVFAPFGIGCAGSVGVPQLTSESRPWISDTMAARIEPVPAPGLVVLVLGLSDTLWGGRALPTSLAPEGMPGCTGYISPDLSVVLTSSGGTAQWTAAVGSSAALVGVQFFVQAVVLDSAAATTFPAIVSNALRGVVGSR